MSTISVPQAARSAMVGGVLWALMPLAFGAAGGDDVEPGTLSGVAAAAALWIFMVAPPLLMLAGVSALRRRLADGAGRVGRVGLAGLALSALGLAAMGVGNGVEVASISTGGGEVAIGHAIFLIGFLVTLVGSLVLGIVVFRRFHNGLARAAGLVLALALPLGIGIGMLGSALGQENDAWFFAAIAVPTGVAWALLGRALTVPTRAAAHEFATVA